tara:strand:+ start:2744 stop:3400 length:657 start_codon:yes stop_codon:yes gene_type:complete
MDIKVDENTVVVFDLDDTLYNELDFLKSAYQHIAKQLEPKAYNELLVLMIALYRSKENVFDIVASRYKISKAVLIDMYRQHEPKIDLFKGAMEIMTGIKNKKGKIGMVTDGRTQTQLAKINALKITHLMDEIVISEAIGTEKPNPENFRTIEKSLSGNTYYYIADNLRKDFLAPNAMGWKTIGLIDNGLNIHFDAHLYLDQKHKPQEFITSFMELNIV